MKMLLATMFAVFSAAVVAQDRPFYAGAQLGQSKAESTCDGFSGAGVSCNDTGNAVKVFGGYRFHPNFAAELAYTDLGEAKATGPAGTITASSNAFDLSLVGSLPVWQRLSAYARLGVYRAKTVTDEPDLRTASQRAGHADEKITAEVYRRIKGDLVSPLG